MTMISRICWRKPPYSQTSSLHQPINRLGLSHSYARLLPATHLHIIFSPLSKSIYIFLQQSDGFILNLGPLVTNQPHVLQSVKKHVGIPLYVRIYPLNVFYFISTLLWSCTVNICIH